VENPCEGLNCLSPAMCLINGTRSANCVCPGGKKSFLRAISSAKEPTFDCQGGTTTCDLDCKQGTCVLSSDNVPRCKCSPSYEGPLCEHFRCSGYCFNKGLCYQDLMAHFVEGEQVPLKVCFSFILIFN